jgi:hypothetical protein
VLFVGRSRPPSEADLTFPSVGARATSQQQEIAQPFLACANVVVGNDSPPNFGHSGGVQAADTPVHHATFSQSAGLPCQQANWSWERRRSLSS